MSASNMMERYLDLSRMWFFEGHSGVAKLEKILHEVCDYEDITEFLADNPAACTALVDFVKEWVPRNSEWEANLEAELELLERDE
jgi:hypothetical protein